VAGPYRHQALIEAPLEEVWELVSDPRTHPDWWPDVVGIRASPSLGEGDKYIHTTNVVPFVDAVDSVWVAERLEHLREARFRCTRTGTFASFKLTPAQNDTFVEAETGIDPVSLPWRLMKPVLGPQYKRWLISVLDALPDAIGARLSATAATTPE
jgi:Polyketide cyclase / dehydrase and lipid transport